MSGSTNGSGATWLSLLEDKRLEARTILGQGYTPPPNLNSDRSFRTAFEKFCETNREYRAPRLETKLIKSYSPTIELAKAVGRSITDLQHLEPNDTLEALIWSVSFALIQCGFQAGAQLLALVELVATLNNKVPIFSSQGDQFRLRFPKEKRVQKPLQDVYRIVVDSYLFIISELKQGDWRHDKALTNAEVFMDRIKTTATQLEEARGTYDLMVHQAVEDEDRERATLEQPSLETQRHLSDQLHRNSKANREVQASFVSIRVLGEGTFGEVDEVRELTTGVSYARKHIHLDRSKTPDVLANEARNEVAVMQKLRHLHIATVLFYLKENYTYSIFMLPVADCHLGQFLLDCIKQEYPVATTNRIYSWFGCLLDALAYAHKLKIKHQDIKLSNILIKSNQPYISDFGLAKDFAGTDSSTSRGNDLAGTVLYRAPEVYADRSRGRKADVFALGCVYSEMLTVARKKSLNEYTKTRKKAGSLIFRECLPTMEKWLKSLEGTEWSNLLVDQICGMIKKEPGERLTAENARNFLKCERAFFCVE